MSFPVPVAIECVEGVGNTISGLRVLLRQRLGPTRFWYDIELEDALLEALRVWQCMTGAITQAFPTAPQGEQYDDVPGQIARPVRVTYAGVELDKVSLWELDEGFIGWEGAASAAPSYWAHNGFKQYVLYPRPSQGQGQISIEGMSDLDNGWRNGVELPLSPGDQEALLAYAQHYLSFKEGQGEQETSMAFLQKFFEHAAGSNGRLRRTNFYRAAMGEDKAEVEGSRSVHKPEGGMR